MVCLHVCICWYVAAAKAADNFLLQSTNSAHSSCGEFAGFVEERVCRVAERAFLVRVGKPYL